MTTMKSSDTLFEQIASSRILKRLSLISAACGMAIVFVLAACSAPQPGNSNANSGSSQAATDWKAVDQALGKAGSMQPGDVYKVSFPRSDLKVTVGGVELKPALALGAWVAF